MYGHDHRGGKGKYVVGIDTRFWNHSSSYGKEIVSSIPSVVGNIVLVPMRHNSMKLVNVIRNRSN